MARFNVSLSSQLIGTVLLVSLANACSAPAPQAGGPPAMPVQVENVQTSTVEESSEFVGALEAQERVALRPEVEGRIVEIYVSPGQSVAQGDAIAQLRPDRDEAAVSGAAASVAAAQAARGTAAARLRSAEAERQRAAADLELQTTEFNRTQTLVAEGAQSQQALDQARNRRDTAAAALRAAEEEVRAARAALGEAEALVARNQAEQAVATEDLRNTQVVAPIAGTVGNVPVKVGDYVTTSDAITSIIQNQALDLNLSVPIERAGDLRVGLPVELMDDQGEPIATGRISFVSPEVDTANQLILAKASFPNNGRLKDGQFVRARVIWSTTPGVVVPTDAVTRFAGQTFVFVVEPGDAAASGEPQQIARQRAVKLGRIQGNSYQVISGIEPNEQVIVSGVLNLSDGVPVMIAPPGASPGAPPQ
ncbi:MAG: efflux RND transporter periplasmic adaptor subunit [Synechococcales cyanobacterium M58_A2018_015]|nr:efflux RND transporter periplasmic adaptor subunit [Synechococcales cyanobacterium M58_A2018_015]